jgi:hypothetical protein
LIFRFIVDVLYFILQDAMRQKINERRQAEIGQVMQERNDRIKQRVAMRKMERNRMCKLIYFVTSEEERITRLRQEEEARKREGTSCFFVFDVSMVVAIVLQPKHASSKYESCCYTPQV